MCVLHIPLFVLFFFFVVVIVNNLKLFFKKNPKSDSCASSDELVSMTEVSFFLLFVALLFALCCFLVLHLSLAVMVWGADRLV